MPKSVIASICFIVISIIASMMMFPYEMLTLLLCCGLIASIIRLMMYIAEGK